MAVAAHLLSTNNLRKSQPALLVLGLFALIVLSLTLLGTALVAIRSKTVLLLFVLAEFAYRLRHTTGKTYLGFFHSLCFQKGIGRSGRTARTTVSAARLVFAIQVERDCSADDLGDCGSGFLLFGLEASYDLRCQDDTLLHLDS
jgi:hypothetical protein